MVSHGVFAGGPVRNKPAKDVVQRLRGGKNVCSYLCCHTRASGPTPELLMPLQRQSNILLTILQSWSCSKCNRIFGNDAITVELNRHTLQNCNMWVKVWCIFGISYIYSYKCSKHQVLSVLNFPLLQQCFPSEVQNWNFNGGPQAKSKQLFGLSC